MKCCGESLVRGTPGKAFLDRSSHERFTAVVTLFLCRFNKFLGLGE